jgi:hypothetical protein
MTGFMMRGIVVGMGATLAMDLWNLFLKRAFGIPSLNYCLLGRWLLHMPAGRFTHPTIAQAAPRPHECPAGWAGHYGIGISLALAFLLLFAPYGWLSHPALRPALLFGIVTVIFPMFVLQPALGLGPASSKTPRPWQARLKSLVTHAVFGLGLYLSALALPQ